MGEGLIPAHFLIAIPRTANIITPTPRQRGDQQEMFAEPSLTIPNGIHFLQRSPLGLPLCHWEKTALE